MVSCPESPEAVKLKGPETSTFLRSNQGGAKLAKIMRVFLISE